MTRLLTATLCGLALVALGFWLGTPPPARVVGYRTHLVVPVPCLDALDHGEDLITLNGQAVTLTARALDRDPRAPQDLLELLGRAEPLTATYRTAATRCRNLATRSPDRGATR